eukprot:Skav231787  [mRNA]  locus=scaffold3283:300863:305103:+ [translate_table: standard]
MNQRLRRRASEKCLRGLLPGVKGDQSPELLGAGGPMQQKVMKVCQAFGVNMYSWPVSADQAAMKLQQLQKVVKEKDAALKGFSDFMRSEAQDLLTPPSHNPQGNSKMEEWRLFCIKEKAIYNILNLCSGEIALRRRGPEESGVAMRGPGHNPWRPAAAALGCAMRADDTALDTAEMDWKQRFGQYEQTCQVIVIRG